MKTISLFLMLCALAGCAAKAEVKKEQQQLLFILHATHGYYANGKLTLTNISPAVSYFSDRPFRRAGTMEMAHFLDAWTTDKRESNFTTNPPNAGLVFFEEQGKKYSEISLELMSPEYDENKGVLIFDVRFLDNKELPNNKQMDEVSVFVDTASMESTT